MAEKEAKKEKTEGHAAEEKDAKKGGSFLTKLPVLLGGVMVVEAVVLILGLKMLGFGKPKEVVAAELAHEDPAEHAAEGDAAHAEDAKGDEGHAAADAEHGAGDAKAGGDHEKPVDGAAPTRKFDKKRPYEISVVEFRAPNKMSGRTFLYDIVIFAVVKGEHMDKVQRTLKDREALIKDRIRTIIAQSDPEKLGGGSEPGLETLRRQVKYQLDEIVGDNLIEEVLVPRCIPFRTDF